MSASASPNVFIAGATSAIAQAVARRLAERHAAFYLVARDAGKLEAVRLDLLARGARAVHGRVADLDARAEHEAIVRDAVAAGALDIALIAYGVLGDQGECRASPEAAARQVETNLVSPVSLLTALAAAMEPVGRGTLVVLSSVAGDRGRQSNYTYGASKGGLSIFLEGLRHRLWARGVKVLTVKAGFVDTPMTRDFAKGPLWATPDRVARDIVRAIDSGSTVLYTPWFWRWIMRVVRWLPDRILFRTSL